MNPYIEDAMRRGMMLLLQYQVPCECNESGMCERCKLLLELDGGNSFED